MEKDKQKKKVFSYIITATYEGNSCVQAQHQCYNARSTSPINNELVFTSEKLPNHQSLIFENKIQTSLKDITMQLYVGMDARQPGAIVKSFSLYI